MTDGGDCNISLITFQRTWLRPWAFFALEEKALRDKLLQLFPGGAFVAFDREELSSPNWRQIQIRGKELQRALDRARLHRSTVSAALRGRRSDQADQLKKPLGVEGLGYANYSSKLLA